MSYRVYGQSDGQTDRQTHTHTDRQTKVITIPQHKICDGEKTLILGNLLLSTDSTLHLRLEKFIREKVKRPNKDNSGIVSGLKTRNKKSVRSNSMRELLR